MTIPSKAWAEISDGQIDADSPLDTTLLTSIRDDLVHLHEWLGNDYIAAQNHDHDGVNSAFITSVADGAITPAKLSPQLAGDYIIHYDPDEKTTNSTSMIKVKDVRIGPGGIYRINFSLRNSTTYIYSQAQVYKNNSPHGTLRSIVSATYITYSEDLLFEPGDNIQIYFRTMSSPNITYLKNFYIMVQEPLFIGRLNGY